MSPSVLFVLSDLDPVARAVGELWGTPASTGWHVDGASVRELGSGRYLLRRAGRHVEDERLDGRLPEALRAQRPTLAFPSIHRSEQGILSLTVHPLGNVGPRAEVGGRGGALVPTDPRRMTATLRLLAEGATALGLPASFEATHHGPYVELPAFFAEIGIGPAAAPTPESARLLAHALLEAADDPSDRVVLGVGGGHYAPHFTELALDRRFAFGHLISRHAQVHADSGTAQDAWRLTPGATGILFARAEDARHPVWASVGPRARDRDAPRRSVPGPPTDASSPSAGT